MCAEIRLDPGDVPRRHSGRRREERSCRRRHACQGRGRAVVVVDDDEAVCLVIRRWEQRNLLIEEREVVGGGEPEVEREQARVEFEVRDAVEVEPGRERDGGGEGLEGLGSEGVALAVDVGEQVRVDVDSRYGEQGPRECADVHCTQDQHRSGVQRRSTY